MKLRWKEGIKSSSQSGFSMVEMLMAAFILAVGILGLTMLQTMSIRSTTGSRSMSTAVLIAEQVLDEIEADGRNSLLFARSIPPVVPTTTGAFTAAPVAPPDDAPSRTYNFAGRRTDVDPVDITPYFQVYIQPDDVPTGTNGVVTPVPGLGGVANMTVLVQWSEDGSGVARQVVLTRRVAYAIA